MIKQLKSVLIFIEQYAIWKYMKVQIIMKIKRKVLQTPQFDNINNNINLYA